jgi:hypothetical protein
MNPRLTRWKLGEFHSVGISVVTLGKLFGAVEGNQAVRQPSPSLQSYDVV